jgi:hypothetical protein
MGGEQFAQALYLCAGLIAKRGLDASRFPRIL